MGDSLTPEVSIESLQPELYAQTSVESVEGSSMDAGPGGGYGDVDLHFDGPIESTPLGQIHFSLIYDDHKKSLMVKIVEACHLPLPKSTDNHLAPLPLLTPTLAPTPTSTSATVSDVGGQQQPVANQPDLASSFTPIRHKKDPPHSNP